MTEFKRSPWVAAAWKGARLKIFAGQNPICAERYRRGQDPWPYRLLFDTCSSYGKERAIPNV